MFCESISSSRNRRRSAGASTGRLFRLEYADRIDNRKRQGDRTVRSVVQNQLCECGSTGAQRFQQLEPPVIFILGQDLPATLVFVPETPDPVLLPELRRE